ncbi:MAG TPA: hypothetical protein VFF73_29200 [Planctomycetota bacterium]|nr:hypothetical protein [Planctomycetota bacterium]
MRRITAILIVLMAGAVVAEDDSPAARRNKAIDKGIAWLEGQQASDGSWDYGSGPFRMPVHMKQGTTALAALALLKSGVAPDDPKVTKAFDFVAGCAIEHTYSAACVLLALEARASWEPPRDEDGEIKADATREKDGKGAAAAKRGKPSARDLELAQRCVDFLVKCRYPDTWSYPRLGKGNGDPDLSNTQYALLGLDAAEKIGVAVPRDCYEKAVHDILGAQEKDGPEVATFPVPGADLSFKELRKIEKEMREKIKQIASAFKGKKPGEPGRNGHTEADETRTVEEDAGHKILRTTGRAKMKARGFSYALLPVDQDGNNGHEHFQDWQRKATASMTTAGLASLALCKAHLEGTAGYDRALQETVDQALRDGAAWLAKNFSVTSNTGMAGGAQHVDYYLYGLERAAILLLVPKFGDHDWYDEGSRALVSAQADAGSWDAGGNGTLGPVPDTCFALLFLSRGTTPIVRIPARTATGGAENH